jgi:hypothetical protein
VGCTQHPVTWKGFITSSNLLHAASAFAIRLIEDLTKKMGFKTKLTASEIMLVPGIYLLNALITYADILSLD